LTPNFPGDMQALILSAADRAAIACVVRRSALLALLCGSALLVACGGGDSAAPTTAAQSSNAPATSASTPAVAITGFTPTSVVPGGIVTVSGTAFNAVTSVKVGSLDATFRVLSDTSLELTVPITATTNRVELGAAGRVVLSAADLTVLLVPVVTSVAPTTVVAPGRVTLSGANLDLVREARLATLALNIATRSATSLVLDVPGNAASGTLSLVDNAGVTRTVAQPITVVGPLAISSFAPATIVTGQTLTVNGTNLDRATSVVFANGVTASIAARTGTTRVTAVVPETAASGNVRVRSAAGDEATAASALQVITAIRVDASTVYRVAAAGNSVTVTGTGLMEVTGVRVASLAATITSKSATQLVFTVPAGPACATIMLDSASQPPVAGGSIVVGVGCVATVAGVEFAQVLSQGPSDTRLRLVPGKETWARAFVVSSQSNVPAPLVRLTGYSGAAVLGTLDMAGPSVLPVVSGNTVPDSLRYDEAQSFNVELPAAWVRAGLSVRVEADPLKTYGAPVVVDAAPALGSATRVEVLLVPLVSGGFVPTPPTTAAVLDEITRRFPIPRANITVTMRQSYTLTSVTNGLDADTEWQNALVELNQLRAMENAPANRLYFGIVRRSGGGIAGIGYVPGRSAIGWDSATQWPRTMSHELGHNFSRPHAPCGGVASPDPNYPYAGGVLSGTPLMDSVPAAIDIVSPVSQTDIMGYCNGTWFSDYNYREMQRYMESQSGLIAAQIAADVAEQDLLLIAGTIGLDGLTLAPVQALRGAPTTGQGDYTLRLVLTDGSTIEHSIEAELVDHAVPPERHFAVAVPRPDIAIARIEVLRGGAAIAARSSGRATAQRAVGSNVSRMQQIDWNERDGQLTVQWDASAAPSLAVTYVIKGARTVLAFRRTGGVAQIDVSGLPAGGRYEFAVSDGLNARTITVPR
jgi:IPT/TIG domain